MEQQHGKDATRQPNFGGFDIEDILYLFPVVTLLGGLEQLLIAATIGAPTFAMWVIWQFRSMPHPGKDAEKSLYAGGLSHAICISIIDYAHHLL